MKNRFPLTFFENPHCYYFRHLLEQLKVTNLCFNNTDKNRKHKRNNNKCYVITIKNMNDSFYYAKMASKFIFTVLQGFQVQQAVTIW